MRHNAQQFGILIGMMLGLLVAQGLASTSTSYTVPAQVINASGEPAASASYSLLHATAQAGPIGIASSTNYTLSHGFLAGGLAGFMPEVTYSAGLADASQGRGIAWGDFNGDGALDLYVARGSVAGPRLLFRNNGNGVFTNVASSQGIADSLVGLGAGWADADGDGQLDLYVRNSEPSPGIFWRNLGVSGFTNATDTASMGTATNGNAACWGDYDGDGLPDLFMASASGGAPHLYRNRGGGQFERVDASVGLTQPTWGSGYWADFDNDGDLDLFVGQGNGQPNLLYENRGGTNFVEVAASRGIAGSSSAIGASWGDYDNDGWLDLYVVNTGTASDKLYRNVAGNFVDVSVTAGISDTHDGRSAAWADFDGDGDLDLYVTNCGTNGEPNIIYYNNGNGTFTRVLTAERKRSYGAAWGDYNGDGAPDLLVTRENGNLALYRNNRAGSWLRVRPLNGSGAQSCYGTQVRLYQAGTTNLVAMRQVDGGHATGCQDAYELYFGVGASTNHFDVEVRFTVRGDPLGTGHQEPIIIDKTINPDLGGVSPGNVGTGFVEVRENGRVTIAHGTLFVSGGDVWLLQNSGATKQLTTEGGDYPSGSPSGGKMVFATTRNGNSDLYLRLVTGGSDQPFITNTWNETQPAWATDNRGVAYVSDQDGNAEIYLVDLAGNGARNLTQNPAMDIDPAWSPNSAKIAFTSDRGGNGTNIWVMDCDGANPTNLTAETSVNMQPAWSPDGLHIAFTSYRDGNAEIYVMNFDGTSPVNITLDPFADSHPTWNEKGTEIIFESNRNGQPRLYACDPDGNNVRLLTPTMTGQRPCFPMGYKYPPKSVVFGMKNGRITYWADPVNTANGNFTVAETEFVLPGRGLPVQLQRYYNSQDPFDGPLGFGWRHSYLIGLTRELDGNVTITWGDGHQDFYQPFGSNTFSRIFGSTPGALTETPTGFAFTAPDQTSYAFTVAGRLVSITDKNSNTVSLTYSTNNLQSVTQPNGRNLYFTYSTNRLTRATDHTGRSVGFVYDSTGNLSIYTNLQQRASRYTYDDNHRLIAHIDPRGTVVCSNEYGSVGRVTKQWDANGALTTYAYAENPTNNLKSTTMTDPLQRKTVHRYDAYHRLLAVEDDAGNAVTYGYDAFGNRIQAADRIGNVTQFAMSPVGLPTAKVGPQTNSVEIAQDARNNPLSYLDELNNLTQFGYDAAGNLTSVTNALGHATRTIYNQFGQPEQLIDENGNATVLTYDPQGNLTKVRDVLGCETVLGYDDLGRLTSRTDAENNTFSYTYATNNLLLSATDPRGGQTLYEYDDADRLIHQRRRIDATQWVTTSYEYDNVGRVIRVTNPRGYATRYAYDSFGNLTAVTNALNGVTRYFYNADNLVTQIVDAVGARTTREYDLNGRLVHAVYPGTNEVLFAYDKQGHVTSVTNALGYVKRFDYNVAGQIIRVTNERGHQQSFVHDKLRRLVAMTNEVGGVRSWIYNKAGDLVQTIDENLRATDYVYDAVHRLVAVTNSIGNVTRYTYDANNRLKTVTNPRNYTTTYFYDSVGNVVEIQDAKGISAFYEYDLAGRVVKSTDAYGRTEFFDYDVMGNLIRKTDRLSNITTWQYDELGRRTRVRDAENHETQYAYDAVGRLTSLTDALGNTVAHTYDEAGRLVERTGPRNGVERRTYDQLGRLASVTDPLNRTKWYGYDATGNMTNFVAADGKPIYYQYDNLGRRTRTDYPDYTSATYSYDPVGNLLTLVDKNGTTSNTYDAVNRLLTRRDVYGKTVGYEYDPMGNAAAIIYPDGKRVEYQYDELNRMKQVKDWLTNVTAYAYDSLGNLTNTANANSTCVRYSYDNAQRLTFIRNGKSDGTLIASQSFTLDRIGHRVQEQRDYPLLPTFTEGDTGYSHDMADQMQSAGLETAGHDAKGNLTSRGLSEYEYDYANRLIQVNTPEAFATYVYDDSGNRIGKTAYAGTFVQQRYTLDANRRLFSVLTENNLSNNPQAYYVYGLGLISRITPSGNVRTYHYDAIGSTLALSDAGGTITDTYAYDPFGKVLASSGSTAQPYRFVGMMGVADEGYGLLHMRARYYEAVTGRFLSADPIMRTGPFPSFATTYAYGRVNPIRYVDPSGEDSELLAEWRQETGQELVQLGNDMLIAETPVVGTAKTVYDYSIGEATDADLVVEGVGVIAKIAGKDLPGLGAVWEALKFGANKIWEGIVDLVNAPQTLQWSPDDLVKQEYWQFARFGTYAPPPSQQLEQPLPEAVLTPVSADTPLTHEDELRLRREKYAAEYEAQQAARRKSPYYQAKKRAEFIKAFFSQYEQQQQNLQTSIDALTRGQGWESLSGQHFLFYDTATYSDNKGTVQRRFLSGYWYANVSRVVELAVPAPTHSTWLAAHAAQRSAVRSRLAVNYSSNGVNTPWIPEIYEAYAIDGKFAVYGK